MAHNYQDKHSAQHIEHIPKICQSKLYDSKQDGEVEEKIGSFMGTDLSHN